MKWTAPFNCCKDTERDTELDIGKEANRFCPEWEGAGQNILHPVLYPFLQTGLSCSINGLWNKWQLQDLSVVSGWYSSWKWGLEDVFASHFIGD